MLLLLHGAVPQPAKAAVFDYSAPILAMTAQAAGGGVILRAVDDQGVVHSTSVSSGPTTDLTTADGVAAWSSGSTVYYYTYDPSLTNFVGASATVGLTFDLVTAQGMVAWSSGTTVSYRVYDWVRTSWRAGSFNPSQPAAGLRTADGIVAWSTSSSVYLRTYDVTRGTWNDASGPGPTSDLINVDGVAAWSNGSSVYYFVYDPTRGGWRGGSQAGATFDLHNVNGVVAWSVTPNVFVRVYDPSRGQWMASSVNTGYTADLNILGSTVTWTSAAGAFTQGYNPATGNFRSAGAVPLAAFTVSTTVSNAPFLVAFVDMSIGGSSWNWNFGDGGTVNGQRSPYHRYTLFGRFLATLNLSGSVTNLAIVTDTILPAGTVRINGGAAFTTNPAVLLTLAATDNSGTVADMRFANDGVTWTAWEPYGITRLWTLAPGNGVKTVSAQFRDAAGNTSATATASIQLDTSLPPTVRLVSTNLSESAGTATILANLDRSYSQPVSVRYATADGTATAGADYTATSGLLVFAPGVTNATFPIAILQDTLIELSETIVVNFSDATNALLGAAGSITILDDELPSVFFSSTNYSAVEASGSATIEVRLNAASGRTVTIHYLTTTSGTATAGSDYTPVSGFLVFAPGQTSRSFTVPLADDTLDELNETIGLVIDGVTNAIAAFPQAAVLTILDDDNPVVNLSRTLYEVAENTNLLTVDVTLSKPYGQDVRVNYSVLGGTATPGADFLAANGTLFFLPGETNAQIFVTVLNDTVGEDDETVHVRLLSAANASLGLRSEAEIVILDDDRPPRFTSSGLDASRRFHAGLKGAPGQRFRVEYSSNFSQWSTLSAYTNATGTMEFTDPAPSAGSRFYRTVLP
jgi:PKD repeat protein